MSVKRLSCPLAARRFWIAIDAIVRQRQAPNFQRIARYLVRNYNMTERDIELQLRNCISDKLVFTKYKKFSNGKKVLEKRYSIPQEHMIRRPKHDWYCFECHRGGHNNVLKCCLCHRIFHISCLDYDYSKNFKCYICSSLKTRKTEPVELNYFIKFVLKSLKDMCCHDVWEKTYLPHLPISLLVYNVMSLSSIEKKISEKAYCHIEQFKGDIQNVVHNTFIYLGENSDIANEAKQMFEFCELLVKDIQMCSECYLASVDKHEKDWFCKPCHPPHQLVYAQVRGYPYWPAKVMQVIENNFHVRFFGGYHQRGVVGRNHIKPISVNIEDFQKTPKTSSWEKACKELEKHLVLLKNNPESTETKLPYFNDSCEFERGVENHGRKRRNFDGLTDHHKSSFKRQKVGSHCNDILSSVLEASENSVNLRLKSEKECDTKCWVKQVGSQTVCEDHNHQKHISCDIRTTNEETVLSLTVRNNKIEEIDSNSFKEADFLKMFNPEQVKYHNYQNPECPLNNYETFCVPDCSVEKEKKQRIKSVLCSLNRNFDNCVIKLAQKHKKNIEFIKKRRWCVYCSKEAGIHCCWNTEYCSENCQNEHWLKSHWKVCQSQDS